MECNWRQNFNKRHTGQEPLHSLWEIGVLVLDWLNRGLIASYLFKWEYLLHLFLIKVSEPEEERPIESKLFDAWCKISHSQWICRAMHLLVLVQSHCNHLLMYFRALPCFRLLTTSFMERTAYLQQSWKHWLARNRCDPKRHRVVQTVPNRTKAVIHAESHSQVESA